MSSKISPKWFRGVVSVRLNFVAVERDTARPIYSIQNRKCHKIIYYNQAYAHNLIPYAAGNRKNVTAKF
jgi:hypothetical protein